MTRMVPLPIQKGSDKMIHHPVQIEESSFLHSRKKILYSHTTCDHPQALILILHGLGEHKGRYDTLIKEMAQHRLCAYVPDLIGHGKSSGRRGHMTFREMFSALDQLVLTMKSNHPGTPLGIFGHSMGGLLCIRYLQERSGLFFAGCASSSALTVSEEKEKRILKNRSLVKFLPFLTIENGLKSKDLSRNPSIVKAYDEDPLVHSKISLALAWDIYVSGKDAIQQAGAIDLPLMLIHGSCDKIIPPGGTEQFFDLVNHERKAKIIYDGAFHEVFFDPEFGDRMRNDIIGWFRRFV